MFLYFDMGNVLLHFSHQLQCEQMAALASSQEQSLTAAQVRGAVFDGDLWHRYETGQLDSRQFYEEYCDQTGTAPDYDCFAQAVADIFRPNVSIAPVVANLVSAGYRVGLLSNTNPLHWEFVSQGRYGLLRDVFVCEALSYKLGCAKPDAAIFHKAAELAGAAPSEIFFVDDTAGHVQAARQAGWNAVQYTTTPQLVQDLRSQGLRFNY